MQDESKVLVDNYSNKNVRKLKNSLQVAIIRKLFSQDP